MKTVITLLLVVIFISACKKEDTPPPENNSTTNNTTTSPPPYADYWGCWREATGKPGVYDIILTENQAKPHTFQFATLCVGEPNIPPQDIGVFRNDTLILDNGTFEYWCFIENDTLLYSAYIANVPAPERFVKI